MIEIYSPRSLSKKRLDQHLAQGWFRSCNSLFKPHVAFLDNLLSDIVHIRLKLDGYKIGKRQLKRYNQVLNRFTVKTGFLNIDQDKEALYDAHKAKFKGYIFNSLRQVVYDFHPDGIFDTREVAIYNGEELIGFSFFDVGERTMASIISIYNPAYEKYSLGMFTMMEEIKLAQKSNMNFYYPGYIFDNNPAFDYKIRKENMQYLNPKTTRWCKFKRVNREDTKAHRIQEKIETVFLSVKEKGIELNKRYYPMNSLGYIQFPDAIFLKGIYLLIGQVGIDRFAVIEYLSESDTFIISQTLINTAYWGLFEQDGQSELLDPEICFDQLLEYENILLRSNNTEEVAQYFIDYFFI